MSLRQYDMADKDMHVCQMQVGAGLDRVFWICKLCDIRRVQEFGAHGQSVDSAHMYSQAQPEQDVISADLLTAPPDQGMFDFYKSTSEKQAAY